MVERMSQVPAAAQAMEILRFLAAQASPVPAATIATSVAVPRSTAYHLLSTLQEAGFVVHYAEERRYGLGLAAYELGAGYMRQVPMQRLARLPLQQLRTRVRHSVHLSVLNGREVVYISQERAADQPLPITDVGVRLPAVRTASGRSMLALLAPEQLRAALTALPGLDRGEGHLRLSELRRELAEVRQRGFAIEDGEVTPGLMSIAVAVVDSQDYPIASVAVTAPRDSAPDLDNLAREAARTARSISRRLGRRPLKALSP